MTVFRMNCKDALASAAGKNSRFFVNKSHIIDAGVFTSTEVTLK